MELFHDSFSPTRSNPEIAALCKLYPHYHKGYVCIGADLSCRETKAWLERLWKQYNPYADNQFLEDFRRQFFQRAWELYLGATFLNRGYTLGKHKDHGADFQIIRKDEPSVWIEAIAVNKGYGINQVHDIPEGHFVDVPTDQILLRLTSGLKTKHDKYLTDLAKQRIKECEPYVIGLDRSSVGYHVDTYIPNTLKALFGVGIPAVQRKVRGASSKRSRVTWTAKFEIERQGRAVVPSIFFEDPDHAGISAVIYSKDQVVDCPRAPDEIGENLVIVHNPYAKNPLPNGFFQFGDEYRADEEFVKIVRHKKPYQRPDPFPI